MRKTVQLLLLVSLLGIISLTSCNTSETFLSDTENDDSFTFYYKLYYVVDSGPYYVVDSDVAVIIGFDDGTSNSNILSAQADLELSGYKLEFIEMVGKQNIIVPQTIYNYPVYAIDGGAFNGCSSIETISIPDSVKIIEQGAFSGCNSNLTICGELNSEAQKYAEENGIRFQTTNH